MDTNIVDFNKERDELFSIREEVFIIEQSVPKELEMDENDPLSIHVLIRDDNRGVATGRMMSDGHIGRVAVRKIYRGLGYGREVVKKLICHAEEKKLESVYLGSQLTAVGFYVTLGFESYGEVFLDAGIKHIMMRKSLL